MPEYSVVVAFMRLLVAVFMANDGEVVAIHTVHRKLGKAADDPTRKAKPQPRESTCLPGCSCHPGAHPLAFQQGGGKGSHVYGSETNVIGLPIDETLALLRECGMRT